MICGLVYPYVQRELDDVRRALVNQLQAKYENGEITGAGMVSTKAKRPFSWQDVQLTPEMTLDQTLAGYAVVYSDVTRLKAALRAQATALKGVIR
jgi:hypothetical protein